MEKSSWPSPSGTPWNVLLMLCEKPRKFATAAGLLPCGVCRPCRLNRRRDWVTRLSLESKAHDENLWITLTYQNQFLPIDRQRKDGLRFGSEEYPTLWRPDYQNFFKRLRNYGLPSDFKYFLVGEYGTKFHRPHYHACLFGIGHDYRDKVLEAWSVPSSSGRLPIGHVYFGDVEPHSIQYTAGYTVKKMTSFSHQDLHGRYPEFPAPSKGLSLDSVDLIIRAMDDLQLNDIPSLITVNDRKVPVPRYLKRKVREKLGITHTLGTQRWQDEMYGMQVRQMDYSEGISITDLYQKEKRQALLNQSAKLKLFYEKEKLL
ncbi:replication initiator protein [Apis mellifera associated microvirus 37]|nr:replication initiator protein [Apis mellifera associated microvirus 37]